MNKKSPWAIKPDVPDEVYTDHQEFIEYFYEAAQEAIQRRSMSTVLLGQRRMGKTEIFKRVVNSLFFDQDYKDSDAVVPVYFSFPDEMIDRWDFAVKYVENFLRWYAAFHLHDPDIISGSAIRRQDLPDFIRSHINVQKGLAGALNIFQWLQEKDVTIPEQIALELPRTVSDRDDSTVVMFLDEFQNTHLPQYNFRVVGFMQHAVESNTCPHFVTGSAMSILAEEILGRGSLYGRFASHPIESFTEYWGAELALRAARYYQAELSEIMAPVVSDRCGGNPFYITAVVKQAAKQRKIINNEKILNEILAIDLSSGFIWAELREQVMRWIERINDYGITKWILYLSALQEEERIEPERIKKELYRQERKHVDIETIRDVLIKLSRGDLIDYKAFGDWFSKVNDPILQDFLKVWGRIEVAGENEYEVKDETIIKYQRLYKKFTEYKGYLAETYMIQVLWNSQGKNLPGKYFNSKEDIKMPDRFSYIDQRSRTKAGKGIEVDIYAAAGLEVWLAESKWWTRKKANKKVVENILEQAERLRKRKGKDLETLRLWLFAYNGVTKEAETLMKKNNIFWSSRSELDSLLDFVKLRNLPELEDI
ncbi:ATP-binding protein [Candidatus Magnetomoraceae bacterium gMMP-15]